TVADLRRVATGEGTVLAERRAKGGHLVEVDDLPNPLVSRHRPIAALEGHHLGGEAPGHRGRMRPPMALRGVLVELATGEAPLVHDHLRRWALHVDRALEALQRLVAVPRPQPFTRVEHRSQLDAGHRLDAGTDGEVVLAAADGLRREVDGLLAGPALPVDRDRWQRVGQPGAQGRPAGQVAGLLALLQDATGDQVGYR